MNLNVYQFKRKIRRKILCDIFGIHSYIGNNAGLEEYAYDFNYSECECCEKYLITQLRNSPNYSAGVRMDINYINGILKNKQVYKMNLEKRRVLIEKYIDFDNNEAYKKCVLRGLKKLNKVMNNGMY